MNESLLPVGSCRVGAAFPDRAAAIRACGRLLVESGNVDEPYVEAMVERDAASTVYVGNGVAVPHGTKASTAHIRRTGLAVVQVPDGVDFGKDRVARLLVAVAALGDEHMDLLAEIAELCADDDALARLLAAKSPAELHALLTAGA
ncbi:MAG: PTS sugar transporter subunit IIA [Spirochaetales bacterium]|nr:PTS sugar transporter subunit IIA [Spirochaetales bacterium]